MAMMECTSCGGAIGFFCICSSQERQADPGDRPDRLVYHDFIERLDRVVKTQFEKGWRESADWSKRPDLLSDIGSPAYAKAQSAAAEAADLVALRSALLEREEALQLALEALKQNPLKAFIAPEHRRPKTKPFTS